MSAVLPSPSRDLAVKIVLTWTHMKVTERCYCRCGSRMPRDSLKISGTTVLPLNVFNQARYSVRHPVRSTESNIIPRKEILSLAKVCSFPSWQEEPIGWGDWVPSHITNLGTVLVWANHQDSWGLSWRHRDSLKGRTWYWNARPLNAKHVSRENWDMKVCILQVDHCKS